MTRFEFTSEPKGRVVISLLVGLSRHAVSASLVVRDSLELSSDGEAVLRRLRPHQLEVQKGCEWPGTRLLAGHAQIHRYRYSEPIAREFAELSDGLFGWLQPNRPEDLALYREDGTVLFATIAHEKEAFATLSEDEDEELSRIIPGWRALVRELPGQD